MRENVISGTNWNFSTSFPWHNLEYDRQSSLLFATSDVPGGLQLLAVEPAGETTKATFPDLVAAFMSANAIDPSTHRYFFAASLSSPEGDQVWSNDTRIFTVDDETGALRAATPIGWAKGIYSLQYIP